MMNGDSEWQRNAPLLD